MREKKKIKLLGTELEHLFIRHRKIEVVRACVPRLHYCVLEKSDLEVLIFHINETEDPVCHLALLLGSQSPGGECWSGLNL